MNKKFLVTNLAFSTIFILFLLLDRITKKWAAVTLPKGDIDIIPDILTLHYLENRGAAFGMLQDQKVFFVLIAVIILAVIVYVLIKVPYQKMYTKLHITLVFIASGAVGNLIDRLRYDYVVDFLYFSLIDFPIFNVADMYVSFSTVILVLALLFYYKESDLSFISFNQKKYRELK